MKDEIGSGAPLRIFNGVVPPAPAWFADATQTPFESAFITVDGARIAYRAWGERGKPGLLFFHGNAAHLGWWSFLAPFFAADHRVIVPSLSGMGASDWRRADYSIGGYLKEGLATAEAGGACAAGPPVVIGHSLGGLPVLRGAATHPEHMRAGIIVDCALPTSELMEEVGRRDASHRAYPDLPTALGRFRLSPVQPCANPYIADYLARLSLRQLDDGSWTWRFDPSLWGGIDLGDPWADLPAARAPLAFIRGARSPLTDGDMGRRTRETAPTGTPFIDIPDAYHHVMVDQPLALVATLRALLAAWA